MLSILFGDLSGSPSTPGRPKTATLVLGRAPVIGPHALSPDHFFLVADYKLGDIALLKRTYPPLSLLSLVLLLPHSFYTLVSRILIPPPLRHGLQGGLAYG